MAAPWIALMVALWLVVVFLAVILLGLIRRVNDLEDAARRAALPRVPRLVTGRQLPDSENLTVAEWRGRKLLLLFLSSGCGSCQRLADELRAAKCDEEPSPLGELRLVLITDPGGATRFAGLGASDIVTQTSSELTRAWGIPGTPYAVALDEDGVVGAIGFAGTRTALRKIATTLAPPVSR